MGLKIKISSGYILLLLLLAIIISLFRGEEVRRDTLKEEESGLADMRRLTVEAYMSLLDLSSRSDVASIWTEDDFNAYCTRQEAVRKTLKSLRRYIHTPEQQARIDSFSLLLEEKKQVLATIMNTLNKEPDVSEIVSEKIPVIVSQVWNVPVQTEEKAPAPEKKEEPPVKGKKKSIWNIFKKKETKSAYLREREQQEQTTAEPGPKPIVRSNRPSVAVPLLHSLNREVAERQKEQEEKLLRQMNSLYASSQLLNRLEYSYSRIRFPHR